MLFPSLSTNHCLLVDGSFQAGSFGCAMLSLSRCSSDWWTGVSSGSCNSALEAEMLAIIQGLRWAIQNRLDDLTIISDSKMVVDAVCKRRAPEWISTATFTVILNLLPSFSCCKFVHVKRDIVGYVDSLAKSTRHVKGVWQVVKGEGLPPVNPNLFWV
ncbi:hypothetical protein CsatA_026663 [Cannabis sativa]